MPTASWLLSRCASERDEQRAHPVATTGQHHGHDERPTRRRGWSGTSQLVDRADRRRHATR